MVMALAWNNTESFKRHLEDMKSFRQSHCSDLKSSPGLFKDMPAPRHMPYPGNTGGVSRKYHNHHSTPCSGITASIQIILRVIADQPHYIHTLGQSIP